MSIDEKIRASSHEGACVMRKTGPGCDGECATCDLDLPVEQVIAAHRMAVNILLRAQQEAEKSHTREGFIRCGYVQFAEAFGERLKPYEGCPRGPEGLRGYSPGREPGLIEAVISYLVDAKGNVLVGPDEDYICVPKMWYDRCLTDLQEALKGGATE